MRRLAWLWLVALLLALTACGRDRTAQADPAAAYVAPRLDQAASTASLPVTSLHLITQESGPHRVAFEDLRRAGLVTEPAQLALLGLIHRGQPVPIWVDGNGPDAGLIFVAEAVESAYTRRNVYRLQPDPAPLRPARMENVGEVAPTAAAHFQAQLRLEENRRHTPLPETGDNWFWEQVRPGRPLAIALPLAGLAEGAASLTLSVWAASAEPTVDPDHHLRVTINGETVLDEKWDGKGWQEWSTSIPAGRLRDGENQVQIELPGVEGVPAESVFVDALTLTYPRRFEAQAGRLDFSGPGGALSLSGLSQDALILDVTAAEAWSIPARSSQGAAITQAGRSYVAVEALALPAPAALEPILEQPLLRGRAQGADYLVVGPPDLLAAAAPLLSLRQAQGLLPLAVPVQRIYDEFNHGLAEPNAVQAFLTYAAANWSPAPRYLLLLGDATYDPKGYTTPAEVNRLPAFWVYTVFGGQTVSDVDFARLAGDALPSLAVGRLPARTPAQVEIYVQKLLAYEAGAAGAGQGWRQRVLAVADGSEAGFRADAQGFLDLLPETYAQELLAPPSGQNDGGAETVSRMQEGDFVVAYFGHGSVTQWGKDQIFTVENVPALANQGRLPILLHFTCLTGLFTHPTVESLVEGLLWQADGGAIASLASTSLTLSYSQGYLSNALATALFTNSPDGQPLRLGDAFLSAQRQIPATDTNSLDVLNTFLLFADPALVIRP